MATAQISEAELRRLLDMESWSAKEMADLEKGDPVVRSLHTTDKQELATIGVVRISRLPAVTMEMFRRSLNQKSEGAVTTGGRFSLPPAVTDVTSLELDDETVDQLKKCAVGRCDLNLSGEMIKRLGSIDWTAPTAKQYATEMLRRMLVSYAHDYSTLGVSSLGTYDNRRKVVNLAASHLTLLHNSTLIARIAPEFWTYLEKYPNAMLENVENSLHWSVVDFGLKPSITLSHASAYSRFADSTEQFCVASRQIYASRYLDSSLSFAVLLRVNGRSSEEAFLIFQDRSRSDALDGPLGGVARSVVRKEAADRVRTMLDRAHIRLLAASRPAPAEEEMRTDWGYFGWMVTALSAIAFAVIAFLVVHRSRRRPSSRHVRSS